MKNSFLGVTYTMDKLAGLNRYNDDSDYQEQELMEHNEELKKRINSEEKRYIALSEETQKLEQDLQIVIKAYKKERENKKRNQHNLDNLRKSYSWRFSLPIRMIGLPLKIFKRNKNKPYEKMDDTSAPSKPQVSAKDLEKKLWGGYSVYALTELARLKNSPVIPKNERINAARSLSRWYYDKGQFNKAYEELEFINELRPKKIKTDNGVIAEIKVLKKLDKIKSAKKKIWEAIETKGLQSELCLSMAHIVNKENERLNWFNLLFDKHGYQQIEKIDHSMPLDIENIYTPISDLNHDLKKYKVSVIIPAYNGGDLIHIALNSLLNQTVQNLEIIVVDDCSLDNTSEVVSQYVEKDSRIKLIKKDKNEGAYAARNTGLQYVTGDFVTIHDIDDWSHSQKIEVQLTELVNNPSAVGSISYLIRATHDTAPINGGSLLSMKFLMMNSSSLLVRHNVFDTLGGWDNVRVAGDSELIWRIEKVYGKDSIIHVESEIPFSIALSTERSLTGTSTTHVKTIKFGLRRTYREAYEWWHDQAGSIHELYLDPKKINRRFPCPVPNKIIKPVSRNYDFVLVADFSNESNQDTLTKVLEGLANKNHKMAIFHWPDYNGNPANRVSENIYHLINQKGIDILVPKEEIETKNLLVLTPRILDYILDSVPFIKYNKAVIVNDEDISSESKHRKANNLNKAMDVSAEWRTSEIWSELQIISE